MVWQTSYKQNGDWHSYLDLEGNEDNPEIWLHVSGHQGGGLVDVTLGIGGKHGSAGIHLLDIPHQPLASCQHRAIEAMRDFFKMIVGKIDEEEGEPPDTILGFLKSRGIKIIASFDCKACGHTWELLGPTDLTRTASIVCRCGSSNWVLSERFVDSGEKVVPIMRVTEAG